MKRAKAMMPGKVEGWQIVDAARADVLSDDPEARFLIGTYDGRPIRTSFIVHDGSPSYVETNNSIYALGAPKQPEEKPLTPIQNQAVAVAKKSIIDTIAKDVGRLGPQTSLILDDSAQATAHIIIRALANAHLLVS